MNARIASALSSLSLAALAALAALAPLGATACSSPDSCTPGTGVICTIAGTGVAGLSGDDGPATEARIYLPIDMTSGPDGRLFLIDWNNHRIRTIADDGLIRTIAGTGELGDGPAGPAAVTRFNHPTNLVFDPQGRLVIAAWHNSRIKRIDLGTEMIEDVGGTGKRAYRGDLGPALMADLDLPAAIAFDSAGDMFIMDQANQVIRRVDAAGVIDRFAGQCVIGACEAGEVPVVCDGTGKSTCALDTDPEACMKPCSAAFAGDGGPALEARIGQPVGQAADPAGRMVFAPDDTLYFADTSNHRIRKIAPDGTISTVAGSGTKGAGASGGQATATDLDRPADLALGDDGTLYIADTGNSCVRAIDTAGVIRTVAGVCGERGFAGDDDAATAARLDRPYGIALGDDGTLFVADTYNHRIRVVHP